MEEEFNNIRHFLQEGNAWDFDSFRAIKPDELDKLILDSELTTLNTGKFRRLHTANRPVEGKTVFCISYHSDCCLFHIPSGIFSGC